MLLAQPGFVSSLNKVVISHSHNREELLLSQPRSPSPGAFWEASAHDVRLFDERDVHIFACRRWRMASMRSARPAQQSHMAPATVAPASNSIPLRRRNAGPPARYAPLPTNFCIHLSALHVRPDPAFCVGCPAHLASPGQTIFWQCVLLMA